MKRLATLALAVILISGCNAMKPNLEETELLRAETEKNIQKWVAPVKTEANPAEKFQIISEPTVEIPQKVPELPKEPASQPVAATPSPEPSLPEAEKLQVIPEPTVKIPQKTPELAEEPTPQPPTATPTPEPLLSEQEIAIQPAQATPPQTEQPEETPVMIDWPYPAITCPPEPKWPQITCPPEPPASTPEWPYITAPEPPTYTPEPEPIEPPQEEPTPTPQPTPAVPADPVDPAPEPTAQPTEPTPEPPAGQPSSGYAECSCGTRLTPDELVPHMKAHAMSGESHNYRAY